MPTSLPNPGRMPYMPSDDIRAVYHLTDEQKRFIDKSRAEVQSGNYIDNDVFQKELDTWLNEE